MSRNDIILGLVALVLVVFSLVVSLVVPRRNPDFPGRGIRFFVVVAAALVIGMLAAVEVLGESHDFGEHAAGGTESAPAETGAAPPPPAQSGAETGGGAAPAGNPTAGKQVFLSAGCVGCHTLADAGATGTVGPDLDQVKPPYDLVIERVTNGKPPMPSFKDSLTKEQIQDVAAYVVQATSG